MRRAACLLLTAHLLSVVLAAQSQPDSENELLDLKSYTCAVHLDLIDLEDGRSDIVTVWAHGYHAGMRGIDEKSGPGGWIGVEAFSAQLLKVCQSNPEELFINAVKQTGQVKPEVARR
jgi:hypothetical protein